MGHSKALYALDENGEYKIVPSAGWEAETPPVVESIFPTFVLLRSLDLLGNENPHTRNEVIESNQLMRRWRMDESPFADKDADVGMPMTRRIEEH